MILYVSCICARAQEYAPTFQSIITTWSVLLSLIFASSKFEWSLIILHVRTRLVCLPTQPPSPQLPHWKSPFKPPQEPKKNGGGLLAVMSLHFSFVCRAPPLFKKKKCWDWGIYTDKISILDMNLNGGAGVMSVKEGT